MKLKTLHYVYWTSLITSLETLHELSKGPRWVYGNMNLGVTIFGQSPPSHESGGAFQLPC